MDSMYHMYQTDIWTVCTKLVYEHTREDSRWQGDAEEKLEERRRETLVDDEDRSARQLPAQG